MDGTARPHHVAIIMDGNGRWARSRGLKRSEGHRRGMDVAHEMVVGCREAGVPFLTLFAFSTENWRRPDGEVAELMSLLDEGLRKHFERFREEGVRIRFFGDLSQFSRPLRVAMDRLEQATRDQDKINLQVALNYSGRWDIAEAVRRLADTGCDMSAITEDQIADRLATAGLPEPDLVIRTSGEQRLSNFMLWQAAYAELYFTDVLWPDFCRADLDDALACFSRRERRFGGVESGELAAAGAAQD